MSLKSCLIWKSPSIIEFTSGNSSNALTTASVKKDINPRPTLCFSLNSSLYFFLNSKIGDISTSLKVVSIAVSFLTETNRSATLRRNIDNFLRLVPLLPPPIVPIEGTAFKASSFVILPSFPVPFKEEVSMFFSAKIFLAAGEADPVA